MPIGFFHVLSRRAPDLLLNEDVRLRLLEELALPVTEWEAEVPNSRLFGVACDVLLSRIHLCTLT